MRILEGIAGFRSFRGTLACVAMVAGVSLTGIWSDAHAQSAKIVALGASNTAGTGVGRGSAWPARLQALLKARGINASVSNAGIHGDTTGGMLARLGGAVPAGTQVVILQPGGNDARRGQGGQREGNIAQIRSRLAARNIKVVMMENNYLQAVPPGERQSDRIHFTPAGHARLAAAILPQVVAAMGR
jgi:acyl-CoA thioesterase-1